MAWVSLAALIVVAFSLVGISGTLKRIEAHNARFSPPVEDAEAVLRDLLGAWLAVAGSLPGAAILADNTREVLSEPL